MTSHQSRLVMATSALLVGAAALYVLGAWERWGAVCSFGPDDSYPCVMRGDGQFAGIGSRPELLALAMIMLAVALALMPAALGRRTTGFTRAVLAGAVLIQGASGIITLTNGRGADLTEPPMFLLSYLVLPILTGLALLIPDGDDRRPGLRGGLVGWMLIGSMPAVQFMVGPTIGGIAVDSSPWHEVMVAPFLLVAAAALLAGLVRQRSFSNQHLAHSLSL